MNKIKISNEKERIKIELDFENIEVAKEWFSNEECIDDVLDALDYDDSEDEKDVTNDGADTIKNKLEEMITELAKKASDECLGTLCEVFQNELKSRK